MAISRFRRSLSGALGLKALIKRALRAFLGDYEYWKVFVIDLPQAAADLPPGISIRQLEPIQHAYGSGSDSGSGAQAEAPEQEALCFGLYEGNELRSKQWYWWGLRYQKERKGRSWRLPINAAKSTNLYTVPEYRGRGYASLLKNQTAFLMSERGFTQLYSRIWHNHKGSIRVSEKNGWRIAGYYLEVTPFSKRIEVHIFK